MKIRATRVPWSAAFQYLAKAGPGLHGRAPRGQVVRSSKVLFSGDSSVARRSKGAVLPAATLTNPSSNNSKLLQNHASFLAECSSLML
ncbi:hypothetical protein CSPX01_02775 [Colletotrichum filicis]|nr:hypothetical protein CSPX01_02775 [Colletotrichum filicis]